MHVNWEFKLSNERNVPTDSCQPHCRILFGVHRCMKLSRIEGIREEEEGEEKIF